MKSNIFTIMQKEFIRFFKDQRMVFTTLIMPGLMIYIMYTFLGQGMGSMFSPDADYISQVYVENLPESFQQKESGLQMQFISTTDTEGIKENLESGTPGYDLLMIFPEDFDESVTSFTLDSEQAVPNIQVYFNSTVTDSSAAYSTMTAVLNTFESSIVNLFDVNAGDGPYDLASARDQTGQIVALLVPMLMMIFLFSGCMAVAPEAIAGEKERGTIATLLVTPMKRRDLALGKILSLSVIAVLSGLSSFLGTMLSLPNLAGGEGSVDFGVYEMSDYVMLLALILSTVLMMVALISVVSAFAKTVKEAGTWVMPLNLLVVFIGLSSMIPGLQADVLWMYLIPFYNSVQSMNGIFSFDYQSVDIIVSVVANLFYSAGLVFALTKMFGNERVMFAK